eukprot:scpid9140/ scgid31460/ 
MFGVSLQGSAQVGWNHCVTASVQLIANDVFPQCTAVKRHCHICLCVRICSVLYGEKDLRVQVPVYSCACAVTVTVYCARPAGAPQPSRHRTLCIVLRFNAACWTPHSTLAHVDSMLCVLRETETETDRD